MSAGMRTMRNANYSAPAEKALPTVFDAVEMHEGPVLWDQGGRHVVIDTVEGLEFTVLDAETITRVRTFPLDFNAACDFAYDMDCAHRGA